MEQEPQQKKSLLIIKSHAQGLAAAENFLKNREWEVKSTANLKEALIFLVQNQPQFVMISIDHPNRKVRNLPKVLTQAFPVCVIAFSETASAANMKMLSETSAEYAIFPPITGPSIERTVNKYYKDQQANALNGGQSHRTWEEGNAELRNSMIAIRGGANGTAESAQNLLAQLLTGDSGEATATGFPQNSSEITDNAIAGTSSHFTAHGNNPDGVAGIMSGSNGKDGVGHGGSGTNKDNGNDFAGTMGSKKSQPDSAGSTLDASHYYSSLNTEEQNPKPIDYVPRAPKKDGPGWAPADVIAKTKERPGPETPDDNIRRTEKETLISQGAKEALEKSCINFHDTVTTIEKATNIACILVESPRFSGYLIAAMAKDKHIDLAFVEKIRSRLFRFLKDKGEDLQESESMKMKIREVPFEDWALAHAEFLRKSVHNGEEIAMAFFPRTDLRAKLIDCGDAEMAAVSINELTADVPVEFNVYIYLPRNNKYLLYTPCGGTFFSNQKNRLVSQGVEHLHILRMELEGFDKYRAQNFLNDKIAEFEAKESEKDTV